MLGIANGLSAWTNGVTFIFLKALLGKIHNLIESH